MNFSDIFNNTRSKAKQNSPEILTAFGVSGVLATAYLAGRAGFQAAYVVDWDETNNGKIEDRKERLIARTRLTWKLYIPAAITGVTTVACVVGASKANSKRTAAAVTAYSLTEKAFNEYRDKVIEEIGAPKEEKIRDKLAQDRVNKTDQKTIIITGKGDVLCCELHTGRYFKSDMETLRKAQNDINAKINSERYVPLDEFYYIIDIPFTTQSNRLGWDSDKLMELVFSTTFAPDDTPCLAFEYNYLKPL